MPLNAKDREQQVQQTIDSAEVREMVSWIAKVVDILEAHFAKRGLLVNFAYRTQAPPGYLGTIVVEEGRLSISLH